MIAPKCFGTKTRGLCGDPVRFVTGKHTGACGRHVAGLLAFHLEGRDAALNVEVHSVEAWYDMSDEDGGR